MNDDIRSGAFGRVDDSLGSPLTEEELLALPDGTAIVVIWSGGNGPHRYTTWREINTVYAISESMPDPRYNPLTFVGDQRYHTRVWVAE